MHFNGATVHHLRYREYYYISQQPTTILYIYYKLSKFGSLPETGYMT
jgi:hypothetical protein